MSEEEIIEQFGKMLSLRGFTDGTEKDYWFMFSRFLNWCHDLLEFLGKSCVCPNCGSKDFSTCFLKKPLPE